MAHPIVRADNLVKVRSGRRIFTDLSFALEPGASLAITGNSGSGKTTLINCLGILDFCSSGELEVAGIQAGRPSAKTRRHLLRHSVGHLFQHYGLVESWSVSRNLDVGFIGKRFARGERESRRNEALERVGLESIGHGRTHVLSGGEQQRLALARLIVKRPKVIFADEPTAALDTTNAALVLSVLDDFKAEGCAVVLATHDIALEDWCDDRLDLSDFHA